MSLPSIVLLASIALVLILLRLKVPVSVAILLGAVLLAVFTLPLQQIPLLAAEALLDYQTISLIIIVACAMSMSRLMDELGMLSRLASEIEKINPTLALQAVPAAIGLVPMPAGALVSASAVRDLAGRLHLAPEQGTYINYWFRHIWEFSLPLYPATVMSSAILAIPLFSAVQALSPGTAISLGTGILISYLMLRKAPKAQPGARANVISGIIGSAWPIILLIIALLAGIGAAISFPLTLLLLAIVKKPGWPKLKTALRYGLEPKILLLLYAVMLYKLAAERSGAADALFTDMQTVGFPPMLLLILLPMLLGYATGFTAAFAGLTIPLLAPFLLTSQGLNSFALLLAYVSGMVGILLSPLHLCLTLSVQFFGARLSTTYRYLLPSTLAMEAVAVIAYLILGR